MSSFPLREVIDPWESCIQAAADKRIRLELGLSAFNLKMTLQMSCMKLQAISNACLKSHVSKDGPF